MSASETEPAPPPSERVRVRRHAERGAYDRATIDAILDEGSICHLGVVINGSPVVLPTAYARLGDEVILHGATGNGVLRALVEGSEACLTVTHLDGLVLARSAFHHSANYRSVVVRGSARRITDADEATRALLAVVDSVVPGRSADCRPPNDEELRATLVMALPLTEASAKVRTGPPVDEPEDLSLPHWAGVIPTSVAHRAPVPDAHVPEGLAPPTYLAG